MRWILCFVCFLFFGFSTLAQEQSPQFRFLKRRQSTQLSFELINNLIVIPVWVNGQKLSFLLDSGVGMTLLFNNARVSKLYFPEKNAFKLMGLGQGEALQAYLTRGNTLQLGKIKASHLSLLLVDENDFEFAKRMGTQIDGVLGHAFFKDFTIKINYESQKITVYQSPLKKLHVSKSQWYPLTFYKDKPHIPMTFSLQKGHLQKGFFLIDTGSSDALWLFDQRAGIQKTAPTFDDYLGRGINGNIFGSRGKISYVQLASEKLQRVKVAYPEMENFQSIAIHPQRLGSIGGELLRRFTVFMDYPNQRIGLVPNRTINDPFYFNLSGIELQHNGVELVRKKLNNANNVMTDESGNNQGIEIFLRDVIRYELQNIIEVTHVREGSPAANAGVKVGDVLDRINGRKLHHLKLHQVIGLLQRKPGKKIKLSLRRQGALVTLRFVLQPLFDDSSSDL